MPPNAQRYKQCDKFEDEWLEVAERTYDEKENLHYA